VNAKWFYSFLSYFCKNRSNVSTAMKLGDTGLDLSCSPPLIQTIKLHSTLSDVSGWDQVNGQSVSPTLFQLFDVFQATSWNLLAIKVHHFYALWSNFVFELLVLHNFSQKDSCFIPKVYSDVRDDPKYPRTSRFHSSLTGINPSLLINVMLTLTEKSL